MTGLSGSLPAPGRPADLRSVIPLILVHIKQTWPHVQAGRMTEDKATLEAWSGISDESLARYGDVVAGIFDNTVVSVYDITAAQRDPDNQRVIFTGTPSKAWANLLGQPNPGRPWGRPGDTRPIQYIDTAVVAGGTVPVELVTGRQRAVVGQFVLTVDDDGDAVLVIPTGRAVKILAR